MTNAIPSRPLDASELSSTPAYASESVDTVVVDARGGCLAEYIGSGSGWG